MQVGIAGLWHETNTYAPRPATLEAFRALELCHGDEVLDRHAGTGTVIGGFLDGLAAGRPVGLFSAGAWPCGPAPASTLDALLGDIDAALSAGERIDGALLNLHGAMVAEGCDDVELAVLRLVRDHLPDQPLAAVLDLHGNPSPEAVALCDIVIGYDTYPHTDMRARGAEAAILLERSLAGRHYRSVIAKAPLLTSPLAQATADEPMRSLLARASAPVAANEPIARASLLPGFAYSDTARAGFSVVVTADAAAEGAAAGLAAALADAALAARQKFAVERPRPTEAIAQALRGRTPVVLADVADNVGGGAPGDGTVLLAELLRQGVTGAVVQLADPDVAWAATELGEGAELVTEIGGKADHRHGEPIPVRATVNRVSSGEFTSTGSWMTGQRFSLGATAVLDVAGNTVVVTEHAVPPFHADALTSLGIDPATATILVAKGAIAWRAAFESIAGDIIEVDTPGVCPIDVGVLPRTHEPSVFRPPG